MAGTSLAFPTAPQPPARIIVDPRSPARSARTNPHCPEATEPPMTLHFTDAAEEQHQAQRLRLSGKFRLMEPDA